jgi:hypothetical protein
LGLTTDETEIVWGSDGGAAEIETFFFLDEAVEASSGLFLLFSADCAMAERISVVFYSPQYAQAELLEARRR